MSTLPKTYGEAMAAGWHDTDRSWERGYVSRKSNIHNAPIHIAGGNRMGQYYVLMPSYQSTEYCTRQYLAPRK